MRSLHALVFVAACVILPLSPVAAQCTDCDSDGVAVPADCNDGDPLVFPGAIEACNGLDDDCNGLLDDDAACDRACNAAGTPGTIFPISASISDVADPAIAWTGSGHGVVWTRFTTTFRLFFATLDGAGGVVSPGAAVTAGSSSVGPPSMVWTGSQYGIVWHDAQDGNDEIYFLRVDDTGAAVGTEVRLTSDGAPSRFPRIAWNGSEFGVLWQDRRDGAWEIYFTRVDIQGVKQGGDVRVTSVVDPSRRPHLVWNGSAFAAVWEDSRDGNPEIYFALLDTAGGVVTGPLRVTSAPGASERPFIAWNGSGYGVAWRDDRDGQDEVYVTLLDAGGIPAGADQRITSHPAGVNTISLLWTGGEYGLVWQDDRNPEGGVLLERLGAAGSSLAGRLTVTRGPQAAAGPAVVWNGDTHSVVWVDDDAGVREVFFTREGCNCPALDADGDLFPACTDCDDDAATVFPGAAEICDGLNNDCDHPSWPTPEPDDQDLDGDGVPAVCGGDCDDGHPAVFPGASEICADGVSNDCNHPSWPDPAPLGDVDLDGDGVFVCQGDCADTDAAIAPGVAEICDGLDNDCSGAADDGPTCDACPAAGVGLPRNDLLPHGSRPLNKMIRSDLGLGLVYRAPPGGGGQLFQPLDSLGIPRAPAQVLRTGAPFIWSLASRGPALAAVSFEVNEIITQTGTIFLDASLFLQELDADGQALSANLQVKSCPGRCFFPEAAWNGSEYGIVYEAQTDPNGSFGIFLDRVTSDGTNLGTAEVAAPAFSGDFLLPDIVWNGSEYGVVWALGGDVFFRRVASTGIPAAPAVPVSTGGAEDASVVWTGTHFAVAWSQADQGSSLPYAAFLDASGAVTVSPFALAAAPQTSFLSALASTGTEVGVLWEDNQTDRLFLTRLDTTGTSLGPDLTLSGAQSSFVADQDLVWMGDHYVAVWQEDTGGAFRGIRTGVVECACGGDPDADGLEDCADACPQIAGTSQLDSDLDGDGDACDIDDGNLWLVLVGDDVDWEDELGHTAWNLYRGDAELLRSGPIWTQVPGSPPLAAQACGLTGSALTDTVVPGTGEIVFYLVTGETAGGETSLGEAYIAQTPMVRVNDNPCP